MRQLRSRGKGHHAAVRALAFKWIGILFRCWKDRIAYDENKYLATLARRGSPLAVVNVATAGERPMNILWNTKWKNCGGRSRSLEAHLTDLLRCLVTSPGYNSYNGQHTAGNLNYSVGVFIRILERRTILQVAADEGSYHRDLASIFVDVSFTVSRASGRDT